MNEFAPEYVAARGVLLDALHALQEHLESLVLVGAQAVYHHTGSADLNMPLMTTDADLALDTQDLADVPEISEALRAAGFMSGTNPGHWVAVSSVAVDSMVVPHQSKSTKATARAARMPPHARCTARVARGLEPALIDNEVVTISALEPGDGRNRDLKVAGPAALLTAKAVKISERVDQAGKQPDRLKEKDALDVFRLLQAVETGPLVSGFKRHWSDEHAATASTEALEVLQEHGATQGGLLPQLAAKAAQGDPTVAPSFAALTTDLLAALREASARTRLG